MDRSVEDVFGEGEEGLRIFVESEPFPQELDELTDVVLDTNLECSLSSFVRRPRVSSSVQEEFGNLELKSIWVLDALLG